MRKMRPVVIVSPDEMNLRLLTVLAAALTAEGFNAPFRVPCRFAGVDGVSGARPHSQFIEAAMPALPRQSGYPSHQRASDPDAGDVRGMSRFHSTNSTNSTKPDSIVIWHRHDRCV